MLDIKLIRENIEFVKKGVADKKCDIPFDVVLACDKKRRELIQQSEKLKAEQNKANEEMVQLKKQGKDFAEKVSELRAVSQSIKEINAQVVQEEQTLKDILLTIPNVPHDSVPVGSAEKNAIIREWGDKPHFDFEPQEHLSIVEKEGHIDMARGAKITGRGFVVYKGMCARLERALINFMIDFHTKTHGYTEVSPPFLVNRQSMFGTGQLPKMEEDMYALKDDDLFLIPTAEVPITNLHRDEIIKEDELPIRYVAYTPCFRREAGSYGKDTRGLSRVHQFDKVELVKFVKPEDSACELEALVENAEAILQALAIPYRVVLLATGDLSFAASKCYDIEIWAAGAKKWLEVSSCSNFCDFQARRANIKYREKETNKTKHIHTLNGSGVALARLVICIIEHYQKEDGTFEIPEALAPYCK